MKKLLVLLLIAGVLISCHDKSEHGGHTGPVKENPQTREDSLMAAVMDGHDVGMSKYGKLQGMEKKIKGVLDSIFNLPAKARKELDPYRVQLDSAAAKIHYAISAMDIWMEEFDMDSAKNDMEARISYLLNEKMKVGKVKDHILSSLALADSLLKAGH